MRFRRLSGLLLTVASAAHAQGSVTGYVRDDESLRALAGVELAVDGSAKPVRTDKEGKYALKDLAPGAVRLHVRFLGFAPIDTVLDVVAGKPMVIVFLLTKRVVQLDTVTTRSGRPMTSGFQGFGLRQSKGFGKFIDSAELKQAAQRRLPDMIRERGTFDIMTPTTCRGSYATGCDRRVAVSRRGGTALCLTQIVLDGHVVAQGAVIPNIEAPINASPAAKEAIQRDKERDWGPAFDLNTIGVSTLAGVEIYRSAAEAQGGYGGDDAGCGLIVLWSWGAR